MQKNQKIVDLTINKIVENDEVTKKRKKLIKRKYVQLFAKSGKEQTRKDNIRIKELNNYVKALGLDAYLKK